MKDKDYADNCNKEWDRLEREPPDDESPEAFQHYLKWLRDRTKDLPMLQVKQAE